jgi:hypothetical protein
MAVLGCVIVVVMLGAAERYATQRQQRDGEKPYHR